MNDLRQEQDRYKLQVKGIGPILSLDTLLSDRPHNLIFARNGTGKSFLSRAFRYLDNQELDDPVRNLVSEETHGSCEFAFLYGDTILGSLKIDSNDTEPVQASGDGTIFHVFSEDFVQEELRETGYTLNGDIEHEITVDKANIEIQKVKDQLEKYRTDYHNAFNDIQSIFNAEKETRLSSSANVSKQLAEYKALDFKSLLKQHRVKPEPPQPNYTETLSALDKLKAIPSEL